MIANKAALDYWINSLCQYKRKCMENSMGNQAYWCHGVERLNKKTKLVTSFVLGFILVKH